MRSVVFLLIVLVSYVKAKEHYGGDGALAQLVEHLHGMQRVSGSNPLRSTTAVIRRPLGLLF